jgi:hypothetical protein
MRAAIDSLEPEPGVRMELESYFDIAAEAMRNM